MFSKESFLDITAQLPGSPAVCIYGFEKASMQTRGWILDSFHPLTLNAITKKMEVKLNRTENVK